jgi:Kef-type K+ transport system membrane component KefB
MEIKDPILIFAFMMMVLLVAPMIFQRFKLPGIVGLIISGIIIGPHALGILKPEGSIQLFASVGLIYLMFLAGLEINLHEFNRQKKHSLIFGALTFFIPMIIGSISSRFLFSFSWPTAVLLASMFSSHTLITFPITSRLGINKQRSVIATVGGTIITDTAAILVLAFIAEFTTKDMTAIFWLRQVLLLILFVWFALWILPRIAFFVFRILSPSDQTEFVLILAMVFLTAYFSHLAGMEPIIGAFFAGLALSRVISDQSPLMNRLEFVGNTLFIPFFLISVGMLVNLKVLVLGWDVWAVASFMVLAVMISKYVAAVLSAKILRLTKDEGRLIFGLSVNQAAATLAAVIVGYRLGIFNEAILNGTILMILVTCLVGPWFTEKYGRRIASLRVKGQGHSSKGDDRIMVAISRQESAQMLTDFAIALRHKDSQEPLFPLHVSQDGIHVEHRIAQGEKLLGQAVARIVSSNLPVNPMSRIDVNIAEGMLHALKECHINTLIMGASRYESGMESALFNVSEKVREESSQLIFLCRMDHSLSIDKSIIMLVPPLLELQEGFDHAFRTVMNLAIINKLRITVVSLEKTRDYIEKNFHKQSASLELSFSILDQWKNFSHYIDKQKIKQSDALFFMAARKGRLAWQPSMDRSYRAVDQRFQNNNTFLIYLPQQTLSDPMEAENSWEAKVVGQPLSHESSLSIPSLTITSSSLDDGVRQLLGSHFKSEQKIIAEIMKRLSPLDPIELFSEVVLLHTHFEHLTDPVILLGHVQGDPIVFEDHKKIRSLFVLLSPEGETVTHLKSLTQIARMAKALKKTTDQ